MNSFNKEYFEKHLGGRCKKNPLHKLRAYQKEVLNLFSNKTQIKLLDIGCGYGQFLKLISNDRRFVTHGLDISDYVISKARKLSPQTRFYNFQINSFKPETHYDIITAFDLLEHLPDVDKAVNQIASWLTKEGCFICVVPVYEGVVGLLANQLDKDVTHIQKHPKKWWLRKLNQRFKIIDTKGILRYEVPLFGYIHLMSRNLLPICQALLIVGEKRR